MSQFPISARPLRSRGVRRPGSAAVELVLLFALLWPCLGSAQSFPLTKELKRGDMDDYGVVFVEEDADGALVFDVAMDPEAVGEVATVRRLFFNLDLETSGLWIESLDEANAWRLRVRPARRTLGHTGLRFDWRVDFVPMKGTGRGGDSRRDGGRMHARFRIFADAPLVVDDLMPSSIDRDGEGFQMVMDMKRGRSPEGDPVHWVGGVFEPGPPPGNDPPVEPPVEPPVLN